MAAAALTPVGTGDGAVTSRVAAACGALRQYVKAAEAERMHARPVAVPVRPLPLMPGADVSEASPDGLDLAQAAPAPAPAQMTIVYGGHVLVLDDIPADKAAGLLRLAAGAAAAQEGTGTEATAGAKRGGPVSVSDLPVARKASLQRFMEKRKVRVATRMEPYRRPDATDACPDHLSPQARALIPVRVRCPYMHAVSNL